MTSERPSQRTLVIIPTYNERENLPLILDRVHAARPDVHVLVVDDGSPDGTGELADERALADPDRVHVMHRGAKDGLGAAYLAGFAWGLGRGYSVLVEMDADGSHAPEQLYRLLEAIDAGLASKLPPLAPSIEPVGTVRPSVAARFGLGPRVFVSGSGDNMMGAVGTGNVSDGIVTASLGTSGTVYACSDAPIVDPNGEVAAFCDATGRWLPLACTMNVTVATEMVRTMFGLDHAGLSAAAAAAPPGSEGLLLVPFFEGERTPNVPDGTGVWIGVRPRTSGPAHMARAAMEGVTLGLNYGLNRLRELGLAPREIRLTGGGSKSAVWRQIAADVFGCSVVCPASEEGAAYGAALHAMWVWHHATGSPRPIADIAQQFVALDETTRAMPDARTAAVYLEMQALFDRSARDLGGVFTAHRRLLTRGRV